MEANRMKISAQLAVPLLLAVIASIHLYVGHTAPLSPWVGGGFGMFASVDRREFRTVRASADVGGTRVALDVKGWALAAKSNGALYDRVVALPTRDALDRLEDELLEQPWNAEGGVFDDVDDERPAPEASDVEIDVWRVDYDKDQSLARPVRVAALPAAVSR